MAAAELTPLRNLTKASMKPRTEKIRRHHAAMPARNPTKAQQEADFTAEGAPPPGKVATEPPVLPQDEQAVPSVKDGDNED